MHPRLFSVYSKFVSSLFSAPLNLFLDIVLTVVLFVSAVIFLGSLVNACSIISSWSVFPVNYILWVRTIRHFGMLTNFCCFFYIERHSLYFGYLLQDWGDKDIIKSLGVLFLKYFVELISIRLPISTTLVHFNTFPKQLNCPTLLKISWPVSYIMLFNVQAFVLNDICSDKGTSLMFESIL